MWGRATTAMVVSIDCMIDAAITLAVIEHPIGRALRGGDAAETSAIGRRCVCGAAAIVTTSLHRRLAAGRRWRDARHLACGIHLHGGAEAGEQRVIRVAVFDLEPHGQALHDLHPVARRVLARQHGELRAGAGAETDDVGLEGAIAVRVDLHSGGLARTHLARAALP